MAPNYIRDLLTIRAQGPYSLSSNSSIVLEVPRGKMLRSFGHSSFSMASPKLWNELPLAMRDIPTLSVYKRNLKTDLFELAFNI